MKPSAIQSELLPALDVRTPRGGRGSRAAAAVGLAVGAELRRRHGGEPAANSPEDAGAVAVVAPPPPVAGCGTLALADGFRQDRCPWEPWTDPRTGRAWLRCPTCQQVMDPAEVARWTAARAAAAAARRPRAAR